MRKPAKGYNRSKANPKNRCVIDCDTDGLGVLRPPLGGPLMAADKSGWHCYQLFAEPSSPLARVTQPGVFCRDNS